MSTVLFLAALPSSMLYRFALTLVRVQIQQSWAVPPDPQAEVHPAAHLRGGHGGPRQEGEAAPQQGGEDQACRRGAAARGGRDEATTRGK